MVPVPPSLRAQLLRVELEHREPGIASTLHRRASEWHRDNSSADDAIEHALEAEAFDEARRLISTTCFEYTQVARHATVVAWLEPAVAVHRHSGHPACLALTLIRQAGVLRALDRAAAAEPLLEEGRDVVGSLPDPGVLPSWLADVERPRRTHRETTIPR